MVNILKLKPEIVSYKPTKIPPGFVLKRDTRETLPLVFSEYSGKLQIIDTVLTIPGSHLGYGDYTVKGMEDKIIIERKMMSDLLKYVGQDRVNTEIKLEYIRNFYFKALIIEVDEEDLIVLSDYTQVSPESVRGFLRKVRVDYGVHIYINPKRPALERYVLDSLTYAYIQLRKV